MKKLFAFLLIVSMFSFISCSDDNGPTVEIISPDNNSSYSSGDVIMIQGTAMDDVEITSITVTNQTESTDLDLTGATDRSNISFNLDLQLQENMVPGDYSITITATDNDGNTDSEDLDFTVQ